MLTNAGFLPDCVVAGETIWIDATNTTQDKADLVFTDYLPTTHTLVYNFAAATPISVTASANSGNTGWTLTVTAAQTLLWKAGLMRFTGLATHTSTSRVFAVDEGSISVTASPLAVSDYAAALTAIESAISNFATSPNRSFQLGDLSVTYASVEELLALRNFYRFEVSRETGGRIRRIMHTRFN